MHKKDFTFSGGDVVKVHEVTSAGLDDIQDMIKEASEKKYEDEALASFAILYYPVLYACTDNIPPLEKSYQVDPCDLDNWYLLICEMNADWLSKQKYVEETIKLNGKSVTIKSSRPSIELRRAKLQQEAKQESSLPNSKDEAYRIGNYVAVAAASSGKIPSAYEAKHALGLREFNLWHATVKKLIPEWYETNGHTPQIEESDKKKQSESAPDNHEVSGESG